MTQPGDRTPPAESTHTIPSQFVEELIHGRQNFTPRRLIAPGPSPSQLDALMVAAAAAPDHGELTPWRFILIPEPERQALARIFHQQ